jgi:aspartate-semialdehyde dehydrogenase
MMLEYNPSGYSVAIVGATGLVGRTMTEALRDHDVPVRELRLFASGRSKGTVVRALGMDIVVETPDDADLSGIDICLFSAGAKVSREHAPAFVKAGVLVIDNSSAFRTDPDIPLVVPEVNSEDIVLEGIIANPNCSTIQSVIPLKALDDAFGVTMVSYVTFQAVSGSGQQGINALHARLSGKEDTFYPHDISKTAIPEIDLFMDDGYTKEEHKMIDETRKILKRPALPVSATCVRIPVERGHAVQMTVSLNGPFDEEDVKNALRRFPGIILDDDPKARRYPVATDVIGEDSVRVGRIRRDLADPGRVLLYVVADNIRKGAAGNAVQILRHALGRLNP